MLPGRVFPDNALIHATAIAQNVSHHPVWVLAGGAPSSGKSLPQIEVLSGQHIVYPPALSWSWAVPGPPPISLQLKPGKMLRARIYIILRGPRVRATVTLMRTQISFNDTIDLTTSALTMTLTAPRPLALSQATTPGGPQVEIERPPGSIGRLLYQSSTECTGQTVGEQTIFWTRTSSLTFTPGCGPIQQWHLVAGWPGYSVAEVDRPLPSAPQSLNSE
jgi:hypothetical protein